MVHKKKPKQQIAQPIPEDDNPEGHGQQYDHDAGKKAKLIVRNLPFKGLSEQSFRELFQEYGEITDLKLLKTEENRYVGCGFIQFKTVKSAARAIHYVNGKEVSGRKVIVDWALPKNSFIQKVQEFKSETEVKKEVKSEDSESEGEVLDYVIDGKLFNARKKDKEDGSASDDDNDDEDEEDEGEEEEEEEDDDHSNKPETSKTKSNDVEEGKTVFFKNIPFSATQDDLKECVRQYGPVYYALICVDPVTEHSKGTAFVKFKEKESADKCIQDSMKMFIEDTAIEATRALSKENLVTQKSKAKSTSGKDSRNLYLVREGLIMAGSEAAVGVSAGDMTKRLQIEQWKTQILRNLNMFVARTRIVIHNLPSTLDDAALKSLVLKHGNPRAIVKEARIMRDRKNFNQQGLGASKEIGFVTFTKHEDALTALRNINNNPSIFTPKKRPIVAFSIENRAILNLKQKRIDKSKAKLGILNEGKSDKLNRKQRRWIKRKQKIIEKRRDSKQKGKTVENKPGLKRKRKGADEGPAPKKKEKVSEEAPNQGFSGILAEPGKKINMRSRLKLKAQASMHQGNLKKEKKLRKQQKQRNLKLAPMKQPRQKKGKVNLNDDAQFTKLVSRYKEKIEKSSFKKWYDS